jgi:hypothetical protein
MGLFATALAAFVINSYKFLLPDSAGNEVVLLSQISQQLYGLSNGSEVPITASLMSISPQSSIQHSAPPASAVWVNSFWFLSLIISLFCSLLTTLQQRWARRYLQVTQPQVAIHERAHIRTYFAEGVTCFMCPLPLRPSCLFFTYWFSSSWQASSFPSLQSTTPSHMSSSPQQPSAPLCTPPSCSCQSYATAVHTPHPSWRPLGISLERQPWLLSTLSIA